MAAGASSSRVVEAEKSTADGVVIVEREALMTVFLMLRTLLRVSKLQREWVLGHRTHQLVDRQRFGPQVCFTYHSIILDSFMHWGQLHIFFLRVG